MTLKDIEKAQTGQKIVDEIIQLKKLLSAKPEQVEIKQFHGGYYMPFGVSNDITKKHAGEFIKAIIPDIKIRIQELEKDFEML